MKFSTLYIIGSILVLFFLFGCENTLAPQSDILDSNPNDINNDCSAQIGDYIWLDADLNGLQDAEETGIAGVIIYLLNADSVAIDTAVSDNNGLYQFKELCINEYYLQYDSESLPKGYESTISLRGNDIQKDSNVNLTAINVEDKLTVVAHVDFGFAVEQEDVEEDEDANDDGEEEEENDDEEDQDDDNNDETSKEDAYESMANAYNVIVEIYALIELVPGGTDLTEVWIALAYAIENLAAANEEYESENYDNTKEFAEKAAEFAGDALVLLQTMLSEANDNVEG